MTQEEIDLVFSITINIYEHPWFKEKKRTREEVQNWVAEKLSAFEIYTIPIGMSWGRKVDKESFEEHKKENK